MQLHPFVLAFALAACAPSNPPPRGADDPPPATAPADTGSSLTPAQASRMLELHDAARRDVGVGPLTWSPSVASYAQRWADRLAADGCRFEHRPGGEYGENLAMGSGGFGVAEAFGGWLREKRLYRGGKLTPSSWSPSGHYTQIVWRDTRRLGCGMATCRDLAIWVCNYDPAGNVIGQAPY